MVGNKHDAVWNWLMTCPQIGDMFFNASRAEDGNTVLIPSERTVQEYNDGSSLRWYDCALTRFAGYSTDPNNPINIGDVLEIDDISEWIERQMDQGNMPGFPEGETITDITVMPAESGWMIAQDMSVVKYMLQFRIEYLKDNRREL